MSPIPFGVVDHLDKKDAAIGVIYEERLRLLEAYDRAGFHGFHLTEHHGSPLGLAPSPGIFLAAASGRTSRIRLGTLVYCLPLYEPLRLIEEICMLDHLTGGRLDLGVGRGISPFEVAFYNVPHLETQPRYVEALEIILKGLTSPKLFHKGEYFTYRGVPMELDCVQKPHPPLWYGIGNAEAAVWAAKNRVNVVGNANLAVLKRVFARYREEWAKSGNDGAMPKLASSRFIVVAETDEAAQAIAARGYARWYASFAKVWRDYGANPMRHSADFDHFVRELDGAIVGTPERVRDGIAHDIETTGCTYFITRFAFGDLTFEESSRSLQLFVDEVMPHFQEKQGVARMERSEIRGAAGRRAE